MSMVIYRQDDGSVAVMHVLNDSVEEAVASLPQGTPHKLVENLQIDPYFIDSYDYDLPTGEPKLNIEKAKEHQRNLWREARKPLLEDLDIATMRNILNQDALKKIEATKQELRDVTETELSDNPKEIKKIWPSILRKRPK